MVALDTTRLAHAGQFWAEEVEKLSHACTELGIPA